LQFKRIKIKNYYKIGIICLNNPENLNLIEADTFNEINLALDFFENDNEIKIILLKSNCGMSKTLTKRKKIFSAGVNIKEYGKKFELADKNPSEFKNSLKKNRQLMTRIEEFKKPVIIAVDGIIIGGFFELALSCDLILASDKASFRLNEINIGLIPGYGGISRLLKIVGKNKTFEIVATGKEINPKEALDLGLVSEIFDDSEFEAKTLEYCKNLAKKSSNSLYLIKNTIRQVLLTAQTVIARRGNAPTKQSIALLDRLLRFARNDNLQIIEDIEVENFLKAVQSKDAREGISAFLEKRKPVWK
jgi:enoyl-CoA hydratase/carnithine racemase